MSINLSYLPTLDYLTYFFCCIKFFLLYLVSYIANYNSNNENIVP